MYIILKIDGTFLHIQLCVMNEKIRIDQMVKMASERILPLPQSNDGYGCRCSGQILIEQTYQSISGSGSQVGVHYELSEEEKFYRNALTRMPDGPAALEEAYNSVEDNVNEVEQYVKVGE